ncbi:MAG: DUF3656 domain-containing protein [Myxococcota bacterium]
MTSRKKPPEILAPAGDWDSLRAGLAAGADAVYFGLDDGFNARARAQNFVAEDLDAIVRACHDAGARAYLTFNTLIFEAELPVVEALLRRVALSGVDALIVQDPAVCLMAQEMCPDLELHASTQMTISSAEGAKFAAGLGVSRVVLPRELTTAEVQRVREGTDLELEVFVHGALCVSWSGQCLTSEAWGGRSANRGQCAQSCRLPYDLLVDGERRPLGEARYLLSPRDLAAHMSVPDLVDIGVHTLKIEGRLKGAAYVVTAVESMRRWVDAVCEERHEGPEAVATLAADVGEMRRVYSRGFTGGFLGGTDHQSFVDGRFPKHRGAPLGVVAAVRGREVTVVPGEPVAQSATAPPEAPLVPRAGMGVAFDSGRPQDEDEPGGPIFGVDELGEGSFLLRFGDPGPDLGRVFPGQRVWVSGDPQAVVRAEKMVRAAAPTGRVPVPLVVSGRAGEPLRATLSAGEVSVSGQTEGALEPARSGAGLDEALLADKLGAFGGTPFRLAGLDASGLDDGLYVPASALKSLRRTLVDALVTARESARRRAVQPEGSAGRVRDLLRARLKPARVAFDEASLVALCRTPAQLEAAIAAGLREVELDWMELVGLRKATVRAREAGLRVVLATTRVQKPGEEGFGKPLEALSPDGVLLRHWAALEHLRALDSPPVLHGDFSLNVTNSLTALHLLGLGLDTFTVSHDLDERQLAALLAAAPAERAAVVVHHHIPTFHTEHCVYAHVLSEGRDAKTCGLPCARHALSLVDPKGLAHPVITDVGCRNTVFEARAQSAAALVPSLIASGVRRFRVELVRESGDETRTVLDAYSDLVAGRITPRACVERVGVHEQFGVVRGVARSMATPA